MILGYRSGYVIQQLVGNAHFPVKSAAVHIQPSARRGKFIYTVSAYIVGNLAADHDL
jgi:hypothetical protein